MFERAERVAEGWIVSNAWGHGMLLPVREPLDGVTISFGVLGTRTRRKRDKVYQATASMLAALNRPLYLLDVRRSGTGGSGSWSPRELATTMPQPAGSPSPYCFLHLSCLAPSANLLDDSRAGRRATSWRDFRAAYLAELTEDALNVAQGFVESAASNGGLAIFVSV